MRQSWRYKMIVKSSGQHSYDVTDHSTLQSATEYNVKAKACLENNATRVCSEEVDAAESTIPLCK